MPKEKHAISGLALNADFYKAVLIGFEHQRYQIEEKIAALRQQIDGRVAEPPQQRGRMSAAGRRRIAAAQRKRWAALKKDKWLRRKQNRPPRSAR